VFGEVEGDGEDLLPPLTSESIEKEIFLLFVMLLLLDLLCVRLLFVVLEFMSR